MATDMSRSPLLLGPSVPCSECGSQQPQNVLKPLLLLINPYEASELRFSGRRPPHATNVLSRCCNKRKEFRGQGIPEAASSLGDHHSVAMSHDKMSSPLPINPPAPVGLMPILWLACVAAGMCCLW